MKRNSFTLYYSILCLLFSLFSCSEKEVESPFEADFIIDSEDVFAGEILYFKDNSIGYPDQWSWYFEGASPEQSDLFSPEVVFPFPGEYNVKLVIRRGNLSSQVERMVNIGFPDKIDVSFSASALEATNEDILSFSDESTGYPTSWLWEFISQDGTKVTSNEKNPEIQFEPGIYNVKLTVSNPVKSESKTYENYLTIHDVLLIEAEFESASRTTYAGGSIQFTDITMGIVNGWKWTFQGGEPSSSSSQNPVVVYNSPGKYKVSLECSNRAHSSVKEKEGYIVVVPGGDLVMYFPFDGNMNDLGPNNLVPEILSKGDAELSFNAETRYSGDDAVNRYAAQFTSTNADNYSVLSFPETDHLDFGSSDFTASFWVKLEPISRINTVFHHGAGPGKRSDGQNRQTWFRFQPSNQYVRWAVEHTGKSGNWTQYTKNSMADGTWHHYVAIYKRVNNAMNSYLYIDGVLAVTDSGKAIKEIDKTPYYIGTAYRYRNGVFSPENFFNGYIDDFILYNRALSEEEAVALYDYLK